MSPVRYVCGVDPGDSTGLFALWIPPGGGASGELNQPVRVHLRFQGPPSEAYAHLESVLDVAHDERSGVIIACERFTSSARTGQLSAQPTAQHVIGVIERLSSDYGQTLVMQQPGDAKKLTLNDDLRRLGLYTTARDVGRRDANDVNDAARHALLALGRFKSTVYDALLRSAESQPSS